MKTIIELQQSLDSSFPDIPANMADEYAYLGFNEIEVLPFVNSDLLEARKLFKFAKKQKRLDEEICIIELESK